jgi:hypothetical protein
MSLNALRLSDGLPHPRAPAILDVELDRYAIVAIRQNSQVAGDHMALITVLHETRSTVLMVLDWVTGSLIGVISGVSIFPLHIAHFILLISSAIVGLRYIRTWELVQLCFS